MPLHPQAALAIQRAGDLPPNALRLVYERQRLMLLPQKPAVAITYQLSIPSIYGPIPVRFYRPRKDKIPCPLLVFFNLAAMVAQMALDSRAFQVALELLIYPMTDQSRQYPSYERNGRAEALVRKRCAKLA